MQVSISKAAQMVGITRATLYRHIETKGITVTKDKDDNPKIDVSELIRVYGDRVRVEEELAQSNTSNTAPIKQPVQYDTPQIKHPIQDNTPHYTATEIEVLKQHIQHLEDQKKIFAEERSREREQLNETIDHLRNNLEKAQTHHHQLSALLTDQRSEEAKRGDVLHKQEQQIEEMRQTMQNLIEERQEQFHKMAALEKQIRSMKEKGDRIFKNLNEQNRKLTQKNKKMEQELTKPIWKKFMG